MPSLLSDDRISNLCSILWVREKKKMRTIDINRLGLNCNVKVSVSRGICVTLVYQGQGSCISVTYVDKGRN